eukprot:GAHX01001743.1.p1 GENE.GAHX01001743.1~~GAHX01001743.1.p1  ORF type:complete len:383 (-),score=64.99 GAHX01001743.1:34-1182(-)
MDDDYTTWKKNTPLIYDVMISHMLEWPSLTLEWFPEYTLSSSKDFITHRLLLGTHTNGTEPNYILISNVSIPNLSSPSIKANTATQGSYKGPKANITVKQKILHEGEANRLRYMPQNPNVIAAKGASGTVSVFDITNYPSKPSASDEPSPDITLKGCTKEGYALSWSNKKQNMIASGGGECTIFEWDIEKADEPVQYKAHTGAIEDICYSRTDENLLASVGDDKCLIIWDTREKLPSVVIESAHDSDVNCVDFSWQTQELLTGGADGVLNVWDVRNMDEAKNSIQAHSDEIISCKFSPTNTNGKQLALTGSNDKTCKVWDLSLAGTEQSAEDAEDGPVEMVFLHGGHRSNVIDLGWSFNEELLVGSVSEDNTLHIWKKTDGI